MNDDDTNTVGDTEDTPVSSPSSTESWETY